MISLMLLILFWMSCIFIDVCDHHRHDICHYIIIVAVHDVIYDHYPDVLNLGKQRPSRGCCFQDKVLNVKVCLVGLKARLGKSARFIGISVGGDGHTEKLDWGAFIIVYVQRSRKDSILKKHTS